MHTALSALGFFARRFVQALLVMLAILVIAFAVRTSLGDPMREIMGQAVPESERAELRKELGLDRAWPVQFADYLGSAARGDLGTSFIYKKPTVEVVLAKFPASFELVLGASLIVLLFCVPAGVYCAVRPDNLGARLLLGLERARHLGARVSHRHHPHHGLLGLARLAAGLRARRDGAPRPLEDGASDARWAGASAAARADALLDHAAAIHPAGARRHAGRAWP